MENKVYFRDKLDEIHKLLLEGNTNESIWLVGKCIGFLDAVEFEDIKPIKFAPDITLENVIDYEKESLISTLNHYKGNRAKTANHLGMSERKVYRKIKEYNL